MKTVYLSFLLHGNMCYDRYTKQEIREKFPVTYAAGIRELARFPQVTAHIDFPGLTLLSLKHHAQWLLDEIYPLVERGQVMMVGCQYAASHALCADEESDLLASRLTMEMLREEFNGPVDVFFPQEVPWHPQSPFLMSQCGVRRIIVNPAGWDRPRRVVGLDGSEVHVYPLGLGRVTLENLEEYYDTHEDGSFIMSGGDFEQMGNMGAWMEEIERLRGLGKRIEWTTAERYEQEVGIHTTCPPPGPNGQCDVDQVDSPSFSRWVGDPEDMIWHGYAVQALEAVRAAGFAKLVARTRNLPEVDVPLASAWTTTPDNAWDAYFEHVGEYPETEAKYLSENGEPTLLSRAWHEALIGLNSDASGWFPWSPRTRHRNLCLQAAQAYAQECLVRFAQTLAPHLPVNTEATAGSLLALNPAPARTVEVTLPTDEPCRLVDGTGAAPVSSATLHSGQWQVTARVELPAYGYRLLGLAPTEEVASSHWQEGTTAVYGNRQATLEQGRLTISEDGQAVEVTLAPFRLSDPSGAAPAEEVYPTWSQAATRVRTTAFSQDFEVITELAWAIWLRLVISLREDHTEVTAEVHLDLPRRIGHLAYDPHGLLMRFDGPPGQVAYDIPYATIIHDNAEPSFVAAQRFAMIECGTCSFGLIALGGNQSFQVSGADGFIAANLGASTQGRADTRPQCVMHEDGHSDHLITSGGDPFAGSYTHRFALVFGARTSVALAARRLRTVAPVLRVKPGGGDWPAQAGLLDLGPESQHVTAFRTDAGGCHVVVNEVAGTEIQIVDVPRQ